ncbi:MAG: aldo/keto reductase [Clostridiales bacterium]
MEKRNLGKTGLKVSLLGFGGFHLCEIPYQKAEKLLNEYLDRGGNYIETASSYGDGESEIKIGRAVSHRRNEFVLVTKTQDRDYENCKKSIDQSLKNLQTESVDFLLMHAVDSIETLNMILSENGAVKAAEEAKKAGKVKHIGISMHGQPDILIEGIKRYEFEAVMATINYFDNCNFPTIEKELIPLANDKGIAIILMKPLGDGYLYKNVQKAFKYAFNKPVSVVVTGINTKEMLDMDFEFAEQYTKMTNGELEDLLLNAPELGDYVCRQCNKCIPCPENIDIPKIFELEGIFDRQMNSGTIGDPGEYALKERLKHWFGGENRAKTEYSKLKIKAEKCTKCRVCMPKCPYKIDIIQKLKNVDYKLKSVKGEIWD